MVQIVYVEHSGAKHIIDAAPGLSVMEGAVLNSVPGIDGLCGGACACATCHVYVDDAWLSAAGDKSEMEDATIEFVEGATANSRLSCQIKITDQLDGLIVRLPESQ